MRKGLGKGKGMGYKNMTGKDPKVHSQSAKGMKQPQKIPSMNVLTAEKPSDIDKWPCASYVFSGKCNCQKNCGGTRDTDGDGVPDSKDCQPLNPNKQDTNKDVLKDEFDEKKEVFEYKDYYKDDKKREFLRLGVFDEQNPLTIDDYPYGFRNRTKIRYWIETTNNGDRFVSQTLNPKTNTWNKPKKSTYSDVMVMVGDEKGHVSYISTSLNDTTSKAKEFLDKFGGQLSTKQKARVHKVIGWDKAMSKVKFEVKPQKFRNRETGEVTESVNIFDLGKVDRIDDQGNVIDEEKEKAKKKKDMETISKYASMKAMESMKGDSK